MAGGGPKQLIGISALVSFGVLTLAELAAHDALPTTTQWLGFTAVYTGLAAAADLGLPIAGPLALLVMVTIVLTRGDQAFGFVRGKAAPARAQRRRPGSAPAGTSAPTPSPPQSATMLGASTRA